MNSNTIFKWNFSEDTRRWKAGFADYPPAQKGIFDLNSGVRRLPDELGPGKALFITGANRSDDLFMYFRRFVSGLEANTTYSVDFAITLASNAPDGSVGIGGSPANSVYLKAGVTLAEPLPVPDDQNPDDLRMNINKGDQSRRGRDSVVLGDIAKPAGDESFDFDLIERQNLFKPFTFTTDREGSAWLYFGTDSGFEGTTTLFYKSFQATFTPTSPKGRRVLGTVDDDVLEGTRQDDILLGSRGGDQLTGAKGGDWFVYRGISDNRTFAKSRLDNHDIITDFNSAEGDRIALDNERNHIPVQPRALFFAGIREGKTLGDAIDLAFRDYHPGQPGRQSLQPREALFLEWNDRTFLVVNNERSRFSAAKDLVIEMGNTALPDSIEAGSSLSINDYFLA